MNSLKLLLTFMISDLFVNAVSSSSAGREVFEAVPSEATGQRFMREPLDQVTRSLKQICNSSIYNFMLFS